MTILTIESFLYIFSPPKTIGSSIIQNILIFLFSLRKLFHKLQILKLNKWKPSSWTTNLSCNSNHFSFHTKAIIQKGLIIKSCHSTFYDGCHIKSMYVFKSQHKKRLVDLYANRKVQTKLKTFHQNLALFPSTTLKQFYKHEST